MDALYKAIAELTDTKSELLRYQVHAITGGMDALGEVSVTVADEGSGVEEADLERLFEPFFRADRSRSRKTGAGGLGLMIVRRAVEAHGGSVLALRGEPRGLVVTFDLPVPSAPASE